MANGRVIGRRVCHAGNTLIRDYFYRHCDIMVGTENVRLYMECKSS